MFFYEPQKYLKLTQLYKVILPVKAIKNKGILQTGDAFIYFSMYNLLFYKFNGLGCCFVFGIKEALFSHPVVTKNLTHIS